MENIFECEFCKRLFKAKSGLGSHRRHCIKNPNKVVFKQSDNYYEGIKNRKVRNGAIVAKEKGLPYYRKPWNKDKHTKGHPQSEETKQKIREARKQILREQPSKNNLRRKSYEFNGDILDSQYEVTVAKELLRNEIKYEAKPHYLEYTLNGESHLYFPDFYLPEYNVYLDPKNDYLIKAGQTRLGISDKDKIEIVSKQNNVNIIILDKNHLLYEQFITLL